MARDTSFFTTIKESVDLEDYLSSHLGVDLVPDGGGRLSAICPFHEEDTPSFKVMDSEDGNWKRWWCFGSCQQGGTVIDAAMKAENFEVAHEAAQYLNDLYALGLDTNSEAYRNFARTVAETESDIERTKQEISSSSRVAKAAERYLHNRGLNDEAIEHFQLGVDVKDNKYGRLSIPLIDKANHPVSIANRALFDSFNCQSCGHEVVVKDMVKQRHQALKAKEKGDGDGSWKYCPYCHRPDNEAKVSWLVYQNPKYKFVRDFDKANFLYNEYSARSVLNKDETTLGLFLAEGYGEVWAGWMSGNRAFCSWNGAELSEWQAREAVELVRLANKPIILVPDFDETGLRSVDKNVRKIRSISKTVEVQIVHGVEKLKYKDLDGNDVACKDLGDVLQHFGPEKVDEILQDNRWAAAEWQIRGILSKKNKKTGQSFYTTNRQMQLVADILSEERSRASLDHLIEYLSDVWQSPIDTIRTWFYSELSADNATSYQHLFTDIDTARVEARDFLRDTNVIPLGFEDLDNCMPGDGARPGQLMMFLGKSGTGKTMLATQILANMADHGIRSVFFSLEQAAKSLFPRLVCQALDVSGEEADELIRSDDPEDEEKLRPVHEIYKNMLIVDNVPTNTQEALSMTPSRIQAIIQEANLTEFGGKPAQVVVIDHLGILEVDEDAPQDVKRSDLMAPGHIMQRLFAIAKSTNVLLMVLQQLPKEVPKGKPFSYDEGRGGSKQTDFCDYILQIWRPEMAEDINEEEANNVRGQYKLALGKNRYGRSTVAHLVFDNDSLRIMPNFKIAQPKHQNEEAIIDVDVIANDDNTGDEDLEAFDRAALDKEESEQENMTGAVEGRGDDIGASAEKLGALAESTDDTPEDTNELLEMLDVHEENEGDPELQAWFDEDN